MNKLHCIVLLLTAGSCFAAMKEDVPAEWFSKHLVMAVRGMKSKVNQGIIAEDNPIVLSFEKLANDLKKYDGDVQKMIVEQGLVPRIEGYVNAVNSTKLVKLAREQLENGQGNRDEIKGYLNKTQLAMSGLQLQKKYSTYFIQAIGPVHGDDIVKYLVKNSNYPSHKDALEDYIALFIYQMLYVS